MYETVKDKEKYIKRMNFMQRKKSKAAIPLWLERSQYLARERTNYKRLKRFFEGLVFIVVVT